ncbi:hypothetical protein J26TS2_00880 [Shouchella clausii]|nr:hypothetical protein J26TS2_00880 [Shouchella clausii]
MATFTMDGKEYELKLTYQGVTHLNDTVEGGSFGLIGKALMGDIGVFANIVHAGLMHHGKNFSFNEVKEEIADQIEKEKLDAQDIFRISNEVVTDSFFYKSQAEKLMADNPKAAEALRKLKA